MRGGDAPAAGRGAGAPAIDAPGAESGARGGAIGTPGAEGDGAGTDSPMRVLGAASAPGVNRSPHDAQNWAIWGFCAWQRGQLITIGAAGE